ncbi:MAG: hypothetical protein MUE95_07160 [Cyclobacteriaceae bacterium]|nr:hypothetical protein [Cyclobacteriaceae bacterium]
MITKFPTLLLVFCLFAWSVITPVQAGKGKQNFKASTGQVELHNLALVSNAPETELKKISDTTGQSANPFCLWAASSIPDQRGEFLFGFVYQHPFYTTLSAQAP